MDGVSEEKWHHPLASSPPRLGWWTYIDPSMELCG